jgi:hypothetical protein
MDPRQQATFIPKRPITSSSSDHRAMGFFSLLTLVLFICTGVVAGGVYLWRVTLQKQLAYSANQLSEQEKAFDKNFISAAVRLNDRIEFSKNLLNKHVAVTSLLDAIGKNTLQSVQFSNFVFTTVQVGTTQVVRVGMKGISRDYTALAAQSIEIGKVLAFKDPVFSEFNLTQEGRISFGIDMTIDKALVEYRHKPQVKPLLSNSNSTSTRP